MPSGRTHDLITFALAPPTFLGAQYYYHADMWTAGLATVSMLFAGLMFGPDLDLDSKPYRRWGPFRIIWKPYQMALSHRSRLSHGLVLGTIFRILYFVAIMTVLVATGFYLRQKLLYEAQTTWSAEFERVSLDLGNFWRTTDKQYFYSAFAGLWIGAAAHTIADLVFSTLKRAWKMV